MRGLRGDKPANNRCLPARRTDVGRLQQHARATRIDLADALEVDHDLIRDVNQPLDFFVSRLRGAEEQRAIELQQRDPLAVHSQQLGVGRRADLARSAMIWRE